MFIFVRKVVASCLFNFVCFFFFFIFSSFFFFFFFQAEDGIRDLYVTGVQTCALPIYPATGDLGVHVPLEHAMIAQSVAAADRTKAFARYSLVGALSMAAGSLAAAQIGRASCRERV